MAGRTLLRVDAGADAQHLGIIGTHAVRRRRHWPVAGAQGKVTHPCDQQQGQQSYGPQDQRFQRHRNFLDFMLMVTFWSSDASLKAEPMRPSAE
jgi:hypothetical protein